MPRTWICTYLESMESFLSSDDLISLSVKHRFNTSPLNEGENCSRIMVGPNEGVVRGTYKCFFLNRASKVFQMSFN